MDRIHPLKGARVVVRTDGTAITITVNGTPNTRLVLMDDQTKFTMTCPQGHHAQQTFSRDTVKARLTEDSLTFYCPECDESWAATDEQKQHLQQALAKGDI